MERHPSGCRAALRLPFEVHSRQAERPPYNRKDVATRDAAKFRLRSTILIRSGRLLGDEESHVLEFGGREHVAGFEDVPDVDRIVRA